MERTNAASLIRFARMALVLLALGAPVLPGAGAEGPLTREEILKQGPEALEKNCIGCHLADKWEGTNRDRDGWAAIVTEMAKLMADADKPRMSEKTFNLIVDYLALTRPQ
jgi:hypothetical protein